jgi:polyisoprenoid-binding protein YceI
MRIALIAFLLTTFAANAQGISTDSKQAPTGRYAVEPGHTQVLFSIFHQGTTNYYGRFDKASGTLNYDSHGPEKSKVAVTIDMTSIDTPSGTLNNELKGAGVFDVDKFPTATFTSTSLARTGPSTGRITGNLTLKNITKPVTLDVTFHGGAMNPMSNAYMIGFSGSTTIRRTDFGITGMRWEPLVSDDVKLVIEALFQQQKD